MEKEDFPVTHGELIAARVIVAIIILLVTYMVVYASGYDICRHPTKGLYIASMSESEWIRTFDDGTDYIDTKVWIYRDIFTGEEKRLWVMEIASRTDNTYDYIYDLPARRVDQSATQHWKQLYAKHAVKP